MADEHWRNTANEVKFWVLDAKAFAPFPILLVVKSLIVLIFGVIFLVFFFILNRKGLNFSAFLRKVRTYISGSTKLVSRIR